jgi:hypothetical protein
MLRSVSNTESVIPRADCAADEALLKKALAQNFFRRVGWFAACLALTGCAATRFENVPLEASQANVERRAIDLSHPERPVILVAISGGGSRAAALGWVVFRSGSVESALAVYRALLVSPFVDGMGVPQNVDVRLWWAVPAGFAICWFLPNSLEMKHTQSLRTALATAMLLALALATVLARDSSPFLYFQF